MSRISGITIEIDGDTSKLNQALKDTNKQIRDTQSQLRDINKALKFQPGNTELLQQKFKALSKQVEETKKKLEILKEADKQAKEQLARGEIGQDQYDALRREIIKTEDQLKSLQQQAESTQRELAGKGWTDFGKKIEDAGKKITETGDKLTKRLTVPLTAIGAASMAAWKEVDDALDGIATSTGATGKELESFHQNFKNVFGSMPAEAETVGAAVGELNTQFGITGEALEQATAEAVMFANINATDVTGSIQGAKGVIEAFGLSADDFGRVLDNVNVVGQNTGVSIDKLFDVVSKNGGVLKEMNLGFEESVILVGQMEQAGLDSSKGLSYMSRAAVNLGKDGKDLNTELIKLSAAIKDGAEKTEIMNMASELFGTKGALYMIDALERGTLDFGELANAAGGAADSVKKTFQETQDPSDQLTTALNKLKVAGAELGDAIQTVLAPIIEKVTEKIRSAVDWFSNLDDSTKEMIVKIGLLVAAAGPLISIGGRLITGVGALAKGIGSLGGIASMVKTAVGGLTGVFSSVGASAGVATKAAGLLGSVGLGPIVGIAGAVVGAGVLIYKNWDTIKEKAQQLGAKISETWNNIKSWTSDRWNSIKSTVSNAWSNIKSSASQSAENIRNSVSNAWNRIKDTTGNIWNGVKSTVSNIWGDMKQKAKNGASQVANAVKGVWNGLKDTTSSIFSSISNIAGSIWEKAKSAAGNAWNALTQGSGGGGGGGGMGLRISTGENELLGFSPKSILPGLEWFDKGAIFTAPTIIGVGEKRPEAVGALEDIKHLFLEALREFSGTKDNKEQVRPVLVTGNSFTVRQESDIDKIAEELYRKIKRDGKGF